MVDFVQILSDSGIPTTQAELNAEWRAQVAAQGSLINNDNAYSPFWRIVNALITQPVLWLVAFMAGTVFPNAFVESASGIYLDMLAAAVNLTRKPASAARGLITFTRVSVGTPYTVPAGTIIKTASINGLIYRLQTDADTPFATGSATLAVPCTALETGNAYNLATGYYAILEEPIAGISAVSNLAGWLTSPGTNIESDADFRPRVRNQFGTASDYHTDSVYRFMISQFQGVSSDAIYFVHDAPRGPGTANAYILFDFDVPAVDYLAAINAYITDAGNHGHGDDLLVFQMPTANYALTVNVWHDAFLSGTEITQLQTDITNFIRCAFRENKAYTATLTYPYERFSFSKLGQELHKQFEGIHSVHFSIADIVSALWVPVLTSLTITMSAAE